MESRHGKARPQPGIAFLATSDAVELCIIGAVFRLTAILAMVPIALGQTKMAGGPPYFPMARAIAGGLAFSTVVSLLFLPTIYAVLDDLSTGTARILRRARGKPVEQPVSAAAVTALSAE